MKKLVDHKAPDQWRENSFLRAATSGSDQNFDTLNTSPRSRWDSQQKQSLSEWAEMGETSVIDWRYEGKWQKSSSWVLILSLGNLFFQPAYGELKIRILSHRIEPELKRHRGGMHYASPNMSSDYLPIIIMLMSVVLLGISVIIIIKCRNIDMLKEEPPGMELSGMQQQPIPLPRPPDHLMTSSTNLKPHIEEIQMATHISLPHCKVSNHWRLIWTDRKD